MSAASNCPAFKTPGQADLDCLIEAVRILHKAALKDDETPCSIRDSVLGLTNYSLLTEEALERRIRQWKEAGSIDLSQPEESLILRAPSSTTHKIDRDLMIRLSMHGSTLEDFYIGLEFFSKASNQAGWGVVAFHFDPPNPGEVWTFAHLQTAQRGPHLAEVVSHVMDTHGHGRLPRIPVPAESIVDLMHAAVLSVYGNSNRYRDVVQSMAGRAKVCHHLRTITG